MKKITLQELWEEYLPDMVSFTVDTDISKILIRKDRQKNPV